MENMNPSAQGNRDRRICDHADAAKRMALRLARRCPTWVAREDLVSAGMVGLIEAADRYDGSRDEPFWTFAEHRIRGAVLDELRRGDILPRRVRQLARKIAGVIARLERDGGRPPSDEQVANELGMSLASYREDTWALRNHHVDSLDDELDVAAPQRAPDEVAAQNRTLERISRALETLDPRDVRILTMHYRDDMSFLQIAGVFGVTPSRVCQLLWRAIGRLRRVVGVGEPATRVIDPLAWQTARAGGSTSSRTTPTSAARYAAR